MYREDGKLAARGRHVKFLPMGTAWDLSFTRLLFPFARMLFKYHHQRLAQDPERTKASPRKRGGERNTRLLLLGTV